MNASDGLLLTFYGDDFTGSTDAMEALARAGLRTVLFREPPRSEQIERFAGVAAVGIAGKSRALPTEAMEAELRPAFTSLRALGAPLVHYKTCSTFDSSPAVGSIGRAIDIGQEAFGSPFTPLVVGAPVLGRYCVFGNLFARSGPETEPFRLDRHPNMRHHPTTPMDEADLRIHLGRQTEKRIALFDAREYAAPEEAIDARFEALLAAGLPEIVLFDVLYDAHLPIIGGLIARHGRREAPLFVAGSSGVEYALTAHWRAAGRLPEPPAFTAAPAERIVVVSGSCSPVTEGQIARAAQQGFVEVALDSGRLAEPGAARGERDRAAGRAMQALADGHSVVLHTSRGPRDPRIEATRRRLEANRDGRGSAEILGEALGTLLGEILGRSGVRRAAVAGGDTASYVTRALGVEALEMRAPLAPGAPLCRIFAPGPIDGAEITFKGGQIGGVDFFESVRRGTP